MLHLTQAELSLRWHVSERTLEGMRWQQRGPAYLKIGGRVLYRLQDVEAYERAQLIEPNKLLAPGVRQSSRRCNNA